jgi:phosphoribosylformimino-5-aminoimidazole carboxamide ribonucleotide (ProFAR) isomerase
MEEIQAAVDRIVEKIEAEKAEILTAIEDLKGQVGGGVKKEEVIAALDSLGTRVESMFTPDLPPGDDVPV